MNGFKKYLSNTAWMVGGRISKAVLNFTVGIFVARYLGPERFGALNYAMGLSLLFSVFGAMGLDSVLVRELVRHEDKRNILLGSALSIRLVGGIVAFVLTIFMLWITHVDSETWLLTLICSASLFFRATDVLRSFFESEVNAKTIASVEGFQSVITSFLRIYFIAIEGDVVFFALCWLLEWVFIGIGFALVYRIKIGRFRFWRVDKETLGYLIREGFPLIISSMAIIAYQQIDKVMLKNMLGASGNEQLGFYSVAIRIMPFVLMIPLMLSKAVAPSLIKSRETDSQKYEERSQIFMDVMTLIGFGLSVILFLFARPIIFLYGDSYNAASPLLKIIAWKGLFNSMSVAASLLIITEGLQKWAVLRNLAGCAMNICLNILLIPKWQAVGAAYATLISMVVSSFLAHSILPPYRSIFKLQVIALFSGVLRLVRLVMSKQTSSS